MQEDGEEAMARALDQPDEDDDEVEDGVSSKEGSAGVRTKGKGRAKGKAKMGKADRERKKKQQQQQQHGKEVKFLEVRTPRWRSGDVSVASLPLRDQVVSCGSRWLISFGCLAWFSLTPSTPTWTESLSVRRRL
jgi:hypothetical protein